ncbi:hypothetical protein GCM10029964_065740 [Kibdelosporangium lantanae]
MFDNVSAGIGSTRLVDAIDRIRPHPRRRIPSTTNDTSRCCGRTSETTAASMSSVVTSNAVAGFGPGPLSTRMSTGPNASVAAWTIRSGAPSLIRSTPSPTADGRSAAMALASSSRRPVTSTFTPSAPSARATPSPSPAVDAHTTAVRPAIPRSMVPPQPKKSMSRWATASGWSSARK